MFVPWLSGAGCLFHYYPLSGCANRKCVLFRRHIDCIPDINIYVWMCDALFFSVVSSTLLWHHYNFIVLAQMSVDHFVLCTAWKWSSAAASVSAPSCTHSDINFITFITLRVRVCVRVSCVPRTHAICVKCSLSLGIPIKLCLCIVRTYEIICGEHTSRHEAIAGSAVRLHHICITFT